MGQLKKGDLGFLGLDFQYRFIKALMEDNDLFRDLQPIIDQNMFTDPLLKTYVGTMKDFYEKNDSFPTYEMMAIVLSNQSRTEIDKEMYAALNKKIRNTPTDGISYIRETAIKFFRQQNIIKCANRILSIAGEGDIDRYDECIEILQEANARGASYNLGEHLFDELGDTLSDDYREPIPTGIDKLDKALNGGLGKGELGVIIGSSGFGKAQPLTARILTPDGYKTMGDMKVGDYVIGRDGFQHKVTGVFPQGKRPIYKVTLSNGSSCECDIEHLWAVNSYTQRVDGDNSFQVLTLKDIIDEGFKVVGHVCYKNLVRNFKVPTNKPVHFPLRKVKVNPYVLGYFLGDGCYSRMTITVGKKDKDEISSILKPILGDDIHEVFHEYRNIWSFYLNGETKTLLKETIEPAKSSDKYIPDDYLYNTLENRIALIQGLLDSDGCANKNGSVEFCSKSEK